MRQVKTPQEVAIADGRWLMRPSVLLFIPFFSLTAMSIKADVPVVGWHLVGILGLGALSALSLTTGFRRIRRFSRESLQGARDTGDEPPTRIQLHISQSGGNQAVDHSGPLRLFCNGVGHQTRDCGGYELVPALKAIQRFEHVLAHPVEIGPDVPKSIKNILLGSSDIALGDICVTETIESIAYEAQFKIATTLGAVALAALGLLTFLLAGQIQRAGSITPLGVGLAISVVMAPALLSLHVALGRLRVRFEPDRLRVELRYGLVGRSHWSVGLAEIQGAWLVNLGTGLPNELVIMSQDKFRSIQVWGEAQARLHLLIRPVCSQSEVLSELDPNTSIMR